MLDIIGKTVYVLLAVSAVAYFSFRSLESIAHTNVLNRECNLQSSQKVKIVVFVPNDHVEKVRAAMDLAGAGHIGNYVSCSFATAGVAYFKPIIGANPTIGKIGFVEKVGEVKLEAVVFKEMLGDTIHMIKSVHPYDQPGIDIYPMLDYCMQ